MAHKVFRAVKYVILILIIAVISYFFYQYTNTPAPVEKVNPTPVVVSSIQRGDIDLSLTTYSYVEARFIIPVVPLVSGEILSHSVKVGDYVHKGDVITQLDDELYAQQERSAKGAFEVAASSYERASSLLASKSISQQAYDEVKGKYEVAKGQHEASLTQLGYTTITSPISGTVLMSNVSVGSMGESGSPVAVLSDLTDKILNISLPSRYYTTITSRKDQLIVYVETIDKSKEIRKVKAEIETISPLIQPKDASFTITCSLKKSYEEMFTVGMYVKTIVVYKEYKDALLLPHSALSNDSSLFIYDEETKRVKEEAYSLLVEHDEYIVVDESLKDSLVVIEGTHLLQDNDSVLALRKGE
ncbi:MAG: efflux RND transporter periplasmic adaptor subunit [Spirochaetia bacterium]|nr:efflux RND transporter periplasmic adaptor subunit [Spirochaetia bacterium]